MTRPVNTRIFSGGSDAQNPVSVAASQLYLIKTDALSHSNKTLTKQAQGVGVGSSSSADSEWRKQPHPVS